MLIGLLRHGEVEGGSCFRGHSDDPLTRAGFAQMQAAVEDGPVWTHVISSPLRRCADFAEVFAQRRGLSLRREPRWKEIHFGTWEGRSASELFSEAPEQLTQFWNDPARYPPPDGERLEQFQSRVLHAWNELAVAHPDQTVLIVTHGGVIRVLLCHILQKPFEQLLRYEVPHGALYMVQVEAGGAAFRVAPVITP